MEQYVSFIMPMPSTIGTPYNACVMYIEDVNRGAKRCLIGKSQMQLQ